MALILTVILVALVFEYINGFHDTANSIASVVSTKVLTPRQAILLAAIMNLWGALAGTAVAKTVSSGIVDSHFVTSEILVAALLGAIVWNLITWWFGLPSSSSHALIGGLVGATLAAAHGNMDAIIWSAPKIGAPWFKWGGILYKVIIPMVLSPVLGFFVGFCFMSLLYIVLQKTRPRVVTQTFSVAQLFSASYLGHSHGHNDAQKTMGIIALALVAANKAGELHDLPPWLSFLRLADLGPNSDYIPLWIKVTCALTMAAGTAAGGMKIIRTLAQKMVKLQPVNGFAADMTSATVLTTAAYFGMPVSTTHAITASIMGVGTARRFNALNMGVVQRILWAWMLTLPASAGVAYVIAKIFMTFFPR
jgi:PiT family inorganic phosphate transporter